MAGSSPGDCFSSCWDRRPHCSGLGILQPCQLSAGSGKTKKPSSSSSSCARFPLQGLSLRLGSLGARHRGHPAFPCQPAWVRWVSTTGLSPRAWTSSNVLRPATAFLVLDCAVTQHASPGYLSGILLPLPLSLELNSVPNSGFLGDTRRKYTQDRLHLAWCRGQHPRDSGTQEQERPLWGPGCSHVCSSAVPCLPAMLTRVSSPVPSGQALPVLSPELAPCLLLPVGFPPRPGAKVAFPLRS